MTKTTNTKDDFALVFNCVLYYYSKNNEYKISWLRRVCKHFDRFVLDIAKTFYVRYGPIGDIIAIANSFGKMLNLTSITLNDIDFEINTSFITLLEKISSLSKLTSLDLSRNFFKKIVANALAPSLARMTNLKILNLSSNCFGDSGAVDLAPSLKMLTDLEILDLSSNSFKEIGAIALAPSLAKMKKLKILNLSNNYFRYSGAVALAPSLKMLTDLEILDLSSNYFKELGTVTLAPSLARMTNLKTLDFGYNDIKQFGAVSLSPSLKMLRDLKILDLSSNYIEATGIALLAPTFAMMTNLTSLNLGSNNIDDVVPISLEQLRDFVDWYNYVTSMSQETELTKKDVKMVASMTAYIETIRRVITLDTRDLGLKSLAHSLAMMTNLRSLDLSNNRISFLSALEPIIMAIEHLEHLTFINLRINDLGHKSEMLLEEKFKNIPNLTYSF